MKLKAMIFFKKFLNSFGVDIVKYNDHESTKNFPKDFPSNIINIILSVKPYTQTSPERLFALCEAVKYISVNQVEGDIVECGVWKGGSMMAVAKTLLSLNDTSRSLYLFDTYEGMTNPGNNDIDIAGNMARSLLDKSKLEEQESIWCYASIQEVKSSILNVGYSSQKIHFIPGKVEDTLPEMAPSKISLLRLDTDWYESTRHELIHLFPRIVSGGVIIIDDYGHWLGARKAVDEYLQDNKIPLLLNRIDYTGRIGIVR
jgi:O-methyltransferase